MAPGDLKTWRKENGYTQRSLADALHVIRLTVSRWETGERHIPSFLYLALERLECKGGEKKSRETRKRRKEVKDNA
jgi:transcriptional regulator with XRE-family HTH domain